MGSLFPLFCFGDIVLLFDDENRVSVPFSRCTKLRVSAFRPDVGHAVPGRSAAKGKSRGLLHPLPVLVAPGVLQHLPLPDPPARGSQTGVYRKGGMGLCMCVMAGGQTQQPGL